MSIQGEATEQVSQPSHPHVEILHRLKSAELRSLKPRIADLSWLRTASPASDEEIINKAFEKNGKWAKAFFENREEWGIQVFADPSDNDVVYVTTATNSEVVTVLETKWKSLQAKIAIPGLNVYLANSTLQGIDVSSILPTTENAITFSMTAWNLQSHSEDDVRSGFDWQANKLKIHKITSPQGLTRCCHEIGHIWAQHLAIDTENLKDEEVARRGSYKPEQDVEERGWEAASHMIETVLFSEKTANVIGKIIADKFVESGIFPNSSPALMTREWRRNQEKRYRDRYVEPIIKKFPELKEKAEEKFGSRQENS